MQKEETLKNKKENRNQNDEDMIDCYESKMKDVVHNLRHGASVIKSMSDKNKKANVINYINTNNSADNTHANDSGNYE